MVVLRKQFSTRHQEDQYGWQSDYHKDAADYEFPSLTILQQKEQWGQREAQHDYDCDSTYRKTLGIIHTLSFLSAKKMDIAP